MRYKYLSNAACGIKNSNVANMTLDILFLKSINLFFFSFQLILSMASLKMHKSLLQFFPNVQRNDKNED